MRLQSGRCDEAYEGRRGRIWRTSRLGRVPRFRHSGLICQLCREWFARSSRYERRPERHARRGAGNSPLGPTTQALGLRMAAGRKGDVRHLLRASLRHALAGPPGTVRPVHDLQEPVEQDPCLGVDHGASPGACGLWRRERSGPVRVRVRMVDSYSVRVDRHGPGVSWARRSTAGGRRRFSPALAWKAMIRDRVSQELMQFGGKVPRQRAGSM